ncbi:MipA/OmpV family protein [Pararhizobium antarcticum]|uniref:MltA-interacting MipA family protein n=1 Tax=Pararhizobium antarcticum TaxID=1798805 RepID=A0A657LLL5_9HYPH|nr:MipA/OmpV family protein [Pararhizobium antarcticum]OJF89640.1 hypothetical protein AX760_24910 [Pararhizobium antarcticum]OJF90815.1 hypothetical protein AX761_22955 [Rhizobium sp. 58]
MPLDTFHRGFGTAILLGSVLLTPIAGQAEGLRYSVRLYAGATTSPLDKGEPVVGVPDLLIEGERFSIGTSGPTYDVFDIDGFGLLARLAPRFVSADPTEVAGIERLEKDIAIEVGLAATLAYAQFELGLETLKDLSDTHDGMAITASVGKMFNLSDRFGFGARCGAALRDQKLATYTYGLQPSGAGGGISAYRVKEASSPSIGVEATFALSENNTLLGAVSAALLPNSVTASPIVKRDTLVSAMIGVRYDV